jgi:hypothetical protein
MTSKATESVEEWHARVQGQIDHNHVKWLLARRNKQLQEMFNHVAEFAETVGDHAISEDTPWLRHAAKDFVDRCFEIKCGDV